MSSLVINGDTSGGITLASPAVAGTNTLTLPAATATVSANVLMTAQNSTSGTSIDFTGIPSWAKRITVMFNGTSTNGTSVVQIQIGSGSVTTSGYNSVASAVQAGVSGSSAITTTGFPLSNTNLATAVYYGSIIFNLIGNNTWIGSGIFAQSDATKTNYTAGGSPSLAGALDRVRITTVNGTDTFDAGSINVLYE
jgi:hypothetical protein